MNLDTPIEKIIYMLEISRNHEGIIFGTNDIDTIIYALGIMRVVCRVFNINFEQHHFQLIVEEHGWIYTNQSPLQQMRERRYSYHQILNELLNIEVETWIRSNQVPEHVVDTVRNFAKQSSSDS